MSLSECPSCSKIRKTMGIGASKEAHLDDSSYSEDDYDNDETPSRRNGGQRNNVGSDFCLDSVTDTVDATLSNASMPINLTLDQVVTIENQLDLYEKVSLGYLLFDKPDEAIQKLLKLLNGDSDKFLYNWAISQYLAGVKWAEKLVEALCIIQNYQVLKQVGYSRHDLDVRFLPHHDFTFVYVNKIRKALYFVCEEFVQNTVNKLIRLVHQDLDRKGYSLKFFDSRYLELYFLYWESVGYIKQDNLTNLCSVLKQMDELDLSERLKQLVPIANHSLSQTSVQKVETSKETKQPKPVFDYILNPIMPLTSIESHISADNAVYVSQENKYYIDPKNPGICLIINQENFYREIEPNLQHLLPASGTQLEQRSGTEHDKRKLEDTFKKFGFKTITVDNLTHSAMLQKIEEVVLSIREESSLFVCIMSHGDKGVVYGVNSCRVNVTTIKNLMCAKNRQNLIGKPKVLILQSCQGPVCQMVSPNDDDNITLDGPSSPVREVVPPTADLFTFYATVPGYGAIRNKKTGSWFIQCLCEEMTKMENKSHFEDICTSVTLAVTEKRWTLFNDQVAMVPMKNSTLRKLLYLPPIKA